MAIAFGAALGTAVGGGSGATSLTVTTSATVPAGSRIIILTGFYNTGVTASASGGSLTWVNDGVTVGTADTGYHTALLSADAPSGLASGTVLTVTYSGSAFARSISCFYLTGVATGASGYMDGATVGGSATAATTWATASLSTTNATDALVAGGWQDLVLTSDTPGASYTEIHDFQDAGNGSTVTSEYRIVAATSSYTGSGTWLASGTSTTIMGAYKAASAGGGATVKKLAQLGVG